MHPEATVHIVAELRPWIDIEFILAIRHTVVKYPERLFGPLRNRLKRHACAYMLSINRGAWPHP